MQKKLDKMRTAAGKYSFTNHHSVRPLDADLDDVQAITIHDCSTNRRDDSCGNSINSVDFSMGSDFTDSKGSSSGYYSPSFGSVSSRSGQLVNDDSSFCGNSRCSTVKSVRGNVYSDFDSPYLEVKINKSFTVSLDDDQSASCSGRKHFVISRGPHNNHIRELSDGLDMSQSSISTKCEQREYPSHLAISERDLDFDSIHNDSFMERHIFHDCDKDDANLKRERNICTRVERRRLTFILSTRLIKHSYSNVKYAGFEKGWETFQNILMGEDIKHGDIHTKKRLISSIQPTIVNQNNGNCTGQFAANDKEFQKKIQNLVDSANAITPLVRSRSLDYSRDLRVNESNITTINNSKDDTKLGKTQTKSKNPFIFLTQKCIKPKQIRHLQDRSNVPACYGCATIVTPHFKNSTVESAANSHQGDGSKRKKDCTRDSVKQEVPISSGNVQYQSTPISKDTTNHVNSKDHFPRSTSRTTKSSPRTSDSPYKYWRKIGTTVGSCSHQYSSISASNSNYINSAQLDQQYTKQRSSLHSNNRSHQITTKSTETAV